MQALLLSMARPSPGETFNLVDDDCTGRSAAMAYAAQLLSVELGADNNSSNAGNVVASVSAPSAAAAAPPHAASAVVAPHAGGSCMDTPAQAEAAGAGAAGASGGRVRGEKRVSNSKAKRLLGWELAYPSYREGLAAIAAQERR